MLDFTPCICEDAVSHAQSELPSTDTMSAVSELFKLFGDPTRVGILCALSRHHLCVFQIAEVLQMSSSAVSHQLRLLKQTGLITATRKGKEVIYSIADRHVEEIFRLSLEHAEDCI